MSRKTLWTLGKELDKYFQELRDGGRSETTIQDYRWTLWNMFRGLDEAGMTVNPRKIGREEIEYIRKVHYEGRSGGYIAGQIKCLLIFYRDYKFCGLPTWQLKRVNTGRMLNWSWRMRTRARPSI